MISGHLNVQERRSLGQLLRRPPRYGINAAAVPLAPGGSTYVRITDIDESGRFAPDPKVGVSHPKTSDYMLGCGELVFARTGASVGKSYLYDPRDGELVYAGFLINVAPEPRVLNPKYLALIAQTKEYWDWVARTSVRSGQPGINGREYAQFPVPLPDIATQEAIAEAMTDVDDLITALERLIKKKQAIKQGVMQQFLTGETRLSGFTSEWVDRALWELATVDPETLPARTHPNEVIDYISLEDVNRGELLGSSQFTFRDAPSRARRVLREMDVLFGTVRPNLQSHLMYLGGLARPVASTGFAVVRALAERVDPSFLFHLIMSNLAMVQIDRIIAGSNYPGVASGDVRGLRFRVPDLSEQAAIGAVLADCEADIRALQVRLSKVRAVKQGMMQELLTGRTRLPVAEPVA